MWVLLVRRDPRAVPSLTRRAMRSSGYHGFDADPWNALRGWPSVTADLARGDMAQTRGAFWQAAGCSRVVGVSGLLAQKWRPVPYSD